MMKKQTSKYIHKYSWKLGRERAKIILLIFMKDTLGTTLPPIVFVLLLSVM